MTTNLALTSNLKALQPQLPQGELPPLDTVNQIQSNDPNLEVNAPLDNEQIS